MSKPAKHQRLVIIKKKQVDALLASLKAEKEAANQQPPLPPDAATYNDYRWLIKAADAPDVASTQAEEETDGQQT